LQALLQLRCEDLLLGERLSLRETGHVGVPYRFPPLRASINLAILETNFRRDFGIVSALPLPMKPKPIALTLLGAIALFASLALPRESVGQAAAAEEAQVAQALADIAAQQIVTAENQAKIDEKIAAIAEEVRVARIFAGRTGGKSTGK
jgi:hypothetical protein